MEKTENERLAWLAGIIDGEAAVYCAVKKPYGNGRKCTIETGVTIESVSPEITDEVMAIYNLLKVKYNIAHTKTVNHDAIRVMVRCKKMTNFLLKVVLPWLTGKRFKSVKMIEFCSARIKHGLNQPYSASELELVKQISPRAYKTYSERELQHQGLKEE